MAPVSPYTTCVGRVDGVDTALPAPRGILMPLDATSSQRHAEVFGNLCGTSAALDEKRPPAEGIGISESDWQGAVRREGYSRGNRSSNTPAEPGGPCASA